MSTPSSAHPSSSRRPSYGTEPSSRPSPITPRRAALLFLSFTTLTLALLLLPAALRHQSSGGDDGGVPQLPGMQRGLSLAEGAGWMTGETARPTEWELLASTTGRGGDALAVGTTSILDTLSRSVEASVDRIGDTILAWLGLDEATEAGASGNGGSLAAWGESSVYVEVSLGRSSSRTQADGAHTRREPTPCTHPAPPLSALTSSTSLSAPPSSPSPPLRVPTRTGANTLPLPTTRSPRLQNGGSPSLSAGTALSLRRCDSRRSSGRRRCCSGISRPRRVGSAGVVGCLLHGVLVSAFLKVGRAGS